MLHNDKNVPERGATGVDTWTLAGLKKIYVSMA
jgi:hypothetical protein